MFKFPAVFLKARTLLGGGRASAGSVSAPGTVIQLVGPHDSGKGQLLKKICGPGAAENILFLDGDDGIPHGGNAPSGL